MHASKAKGHQYAVGRLPKSIHYGAVVTSSGVKWIHRPLLLLSMLAVSHKNAIM